jgi:signal transduction histidine kinase
VFTRTFRQHPVFRNRSNLLLVATFCAIVSLVAWSSHQRYQDFLHYHQAIAESVTGELHTTIENIVKERHRLVSLFAEQHVELIRDTARHPNDDDRRAALELAIMRFFPTHFASTITGPDGSPYLEDFDGFVGDLCLADVHSYSASRINLVRVHPNASVYHFDVMAVWGDNEGMLLISFPVDEFSALLRASQAPGHRLMTVHPDQEYLIEITADGARSTLDRTDYRMTAEERSRILTEKPIDNTRWALIDHFEADFVPRFQRELLLEMSLVIALFGILTLVIWVMLRRNEANRLRSEKLKDEFISVVSHELRTPLTSIYGSLSLIRGGACGEVCDEARRMIDVAFSNSDKLRLLVNDLLDIRKIEAGKMALDLKAVDIMSVIRQSVEQQQGYADRFGVNFSIVEQAEGIIVEIDPLRIGQVMANLLSNAAKFSPTGACIEIRVHRNDIHTVEVAVSDHGPGIAPEFESRLFEKFAQGDASNTRNVGGTGLGLAIVKALVEAHGGEVGFATRPGEGSTFFFRLPVVA